MKVKNKLLFLGAVAVLLVGCSPNPAVDSSKLSLTDSGKIAPTDDTSFDWGDINIEGGTVSRLYSFKNEGDTDLIIKSAQTSCMCTIAEVQLADGTKSPAFGMHQSIPWGGVVKPGEEFSMNVVFDPMAHGPDAVGPITRSVYIETSSVANGNYAKSNPHGGGMMTEVMATGDVLYKVDYEKKKSLVGFDFKEMEYDFGMVKQSGGTVSYDFEFEYIGEMPIKVTSVPTSCACTGASISPGEFKKGDKGTLTVTFDPNLHEEPEGKFFKTVTVLTDPVLEKQPEVKIWAEIDLDLGPEAYTLKEVHED